jgi:hypothetical protein
VKKFWKKARAVAVLLGGEAKKEWRNAEMALTVSTSSPQTLLNGIKKAIDDKKVLTWGYKEVDGVRYYTHIADQWNKLAWFKALIQPPGLVFNIVPPKGKGVSTEVYAIYHGRFAEMLLAHFDHQFSEARASAMARAGDIVKAA